MKFFRKPVPLWSHFAVFGVVCALLAALAGGFATGIFTPPWIASALGSQGVIRNEQVVTSIERKEQVVLLILGAQGISEAEGIPPAVLKDFPLLQKARLMQYSLKAKLGVEAVSVEDTADHEYTVTVPAFIWIGIDELRVDRVFSDDGILSALTEQDSEAEQFNSLVDSDLKRQYLQANQQALRDQTEYYFTKLARSIDPEATLKFEFAE